MAAPLSLAESQTGYEKHSGVIACGQVIGAKYNAPVMAEAPCKLGGFTWSSSDSVYWQMGRTTARDFLYVTTVRLNHSQLHQLSDELGCERGHDDYNLEVGNLPQVPTRKGQIGLFGEEEGA